MQTWYQSQTVHPDMHARVCGARGAPVRCTPTPAGAAGQAIFSAEHPGIPGNPYWISVLILNLDLTFLNCTPPTCIMGRCDDLCTPTSESHCDGLSARGLGHRYRRAVYLAQ